MTITILELQPQVGQGIGVLTLLVLVIISYTILQKVSDEPRKWKEAETMRGSDLNEGLRG
jgi:hypothetical protein